MHTVTELETSVPAFLGKLWKLVEDPETDDLICWAPNGRSFFIRNPAQFARELLPHYYKHNNMASFVRQLNMYGFHKKVSVELGGLKCDRDEMEFAHQYFVKGHPYLLEHIKRKIANKSHDGQPPIKAEVMNKVLSEVRSMRGRQEHLDTRLGAMKRENEALWRELAMLRRKHLKQQEIVNKLIHFLVTLVQPQRASGLSVKRRYPLMIDDHQRTKHPKLSKPEASPTGPVIHELDGEHEHEHDLDSQYIVAEMLETHPNPAIQSPVSIEAVLEDDNAETVYPADHTSLDEEIRILEAQEAAAKKKISSLKQKKKEEMDNHLETMQSELDNLRDLLRGEGYSIDANTLLGLFGGDDPMSFGIPMNPELDPTQRERDEDEHMHDATNGGATRGELMAYNPASSLLDFDDDIFLGAGNSLQGGSTSSAAPNTPNSFYNGDSLELEDSKGAMALDSLVAGNDGGNPSAST